MDSRPALPFVFSPFTAVILVTVSRSYTMSLRDVCSTEECAPRMNYSEDQSSKPHIEANNTKSRLQASHNQIWSHSNKSWFLFINWVIWKCQSILFLPWKQKCITHPFTMRSFQFSTMFDPSILLNRFVTRTFVEGEHFVQAVLFESQKLLFS